MLNRKITMIAAALALGCGSDPGRAMAQDECTLPEGVRTASGTGGSMRTSLGYGIVLNEQSTLTRDWYVVHDSRLPIDFSGTPGVITLYADRNYRYGADATLLARVPVTAVNVVFMTFDVFGRRVENTGRNGNHGLPCRRTT